MPKEERELSALVASYKRACSEYFANERVQSLVSTLSAHAFDAGCSGLLFFGGLCSFQAAQKLVGISSSTPIAAKWVGLLAVTTSSSLAIHFASFPREVFHEFRLQQMFRDQAATRWWRRVMLTGTTTRPKPIAAAITEHWNEWKKITMEQLDRRVEDLWHAPLPVYMVMGLVMFRLLGGRLHAIAPSDFRNVGAFHSRRSSLPATLDYADANARSVIREFGRLFGCHTCGTRSCSVAFHADHQPPVLYVKRMNSRWFRRLLGLQVTQRYYPQCASCSNIQGALVKSGRKQLQTHFSSLRLYHTTGVWLAFICTGGLYVGGTQFHDNAEVLENQQIGASLDDTSLRLLLLLRERENLLTQRLQKHPIPSKEELEAIHHELQHIQQHKAELKLRIKQQQQHQLRSQ